MHTGHVHCGGEEYLNIDTLSAAPASPTLLHMHGDPMATALL